MGIIPKIGASILWQEVTSRIIRANVAQSEYFRYKLPPSHPGDEVRNGDLWKQERYEHKIINKVKREQLIRLKTVSCYGKKCLQIEHCTFQHSNAPFRILLLKCVYDSAADGSQVLLELGGHFQEAWSQWWTNQALQALHTYPKHCIEYNTLVAALPATTTYLQTILKHSANSIPLTHSVPGDCDIIFSLSES